MITINYTLNRTHFKTVIGQTETFRGPHVIGLSQLPQLSVLFVK